MSNILDRSHNLPMPASQFVGREDALAEVTARLAAGAKLVTLTGTGGTGKTRLAVELGHRHLKRFPGGVWFCDLVDVSTEAQLIACVATGLELRPGTSPDLAHLGRVLGARGPALYILDNFEQIAHLSAHTLRTWRIAAPEARFMVTSRRPLMVEGEEAIAVGPLPLPEPGLSLRELARVPSVALFVSRAAAVRPDFALGADNADAICELVRALEGLPLAIELAAARARVLGPAGMLQRLGDRFALLASGRRGANQRKTSLWGAIEGSWRLLASWEQVALAQLSVFRGGWTSDGAEAVLDLSAWPEAPWTLDVLQGLIDHGLVQTREAPSGARFALFQHIAEFAAVQLERAGASDATRLRHARFYGRIAERLGPGSSRDHTTRSIRDQQRDEWENLMEAASNARQLGEGEIAANLAITLMACADRRDLRSMAADLGRAALALDSLSGPTRGELLGRLSADARREGRLDEALALAEQAIEVAIQHGLPTHTSRMLRSDARLELGREAEAREDLEASAVEARAAGDARGEAHALGGLAGVAFRRGMLDEAEVLAMRALHGFRRERDSRSEGVMLSNLADIANARGNWTESERRYQAALIVARSAELVELEGHILANLSSLASNRGQLAEAEAIALRALDRLRATGNVRMEAYCLCNLADARLQLGRFAEAQADAEEALAQPVNEATLRAEALAVYAEACAAQRPSFDVEPALSEATALLTAQGDKAAICRVMLRRARVLRDRGDAPGLAATLAEVDAVLAQLGSQAAAPLRPVREALEPIDVAR